MCTIYSTLLDPGLLYAAVLSSWCYCALLYSRSICREGECESSAFPLRQTGSGMGLSHTAGEEDEEEEEEEEEEGEDSLWYITIYIMNTVMN